MKKGKLICIEGPDFAGKSTCISKLKTILPSMYDKELFVYSREPGNLLNTSNAKKCEEIRRQLLSEKCKSAYEEAVLFAASRLLHTEDIIKLLNKGINVICDRYIVSSLFYQGPLIGTEVAYEYNKNSILLLKANGIEVNNVILSILYDTYKERSSYREQDAMEQVPDGVIKKRLSRHQTAQQTLMKLDADMFSNTYMIDANHNSEDTAIEVLNAIHKIIKQ